MLQRISTTFRGASLPAGFLVLSFVCGCQPVNNAKPADGAPNSISTTTPVIGKVVDASCGQCQFEMEGTGCELAVRIDGKSYFVDGASIDDHGDAHAADGMCNAIRKGKVTGEIRNDRFFATSFELLPAEPAGGAGATRQ